MRNADGTGNVSGKDVRLRTGIAFPAHVASSFVVSSLSTSDPFSRADKQRPTPHMIERSPYVSKILRYTFPRSFNIACLFTPHAWWEDNRKGAFHSRSSVIPRTLCLKNYDWGQTEIIKKPRNVARGKTRFYFEYNCAVEVFPDATFTARAEAMALSHGVWHREGSTS